MHFFLVNNLMGLLVGIAAIVVFIKLDVFFRIIAIQTVLAAIVELIGYKIKAGSQSANDHPLYNKYMLIEGLLLLWAIHQYLKSAKPVLKYGLYTSMAIFVSIWAYSVFRSPFEYANYAFISEQVFLLGWYLFLIYRVEYLQAPNRRPMYWLCGAIVLYAGSMIPYYSLMPYLNEHYRQLSGQLFYINTVISNLANFLILVAFLHFFFKPAQARTWSMKS